jgi:hypothetical protein
MKKQTNRNSLLTLKQLAEVREHLPTGSLAVLAAKHGVHLSYVSKILLGHRKNDDILQSAIDLALRNKQKEEAKKKKVQNQLKKLSL